MRRDKGLAARRDEEQRQNDEDERAHDVVEQAAGG
jgi:hypothetical protein